MKDFSFITSQHPQYIEDMYNQFVQNPASVDPEYKKFFEGFDFAVSNNIKPVNGTTAKTETITAPAQEATEAIDWK
jgi:2-oxoglutarate dehydrogenase E1 component